VRNPGTALASIAILAFVCLTGAAQSPHAGSRTAPALITEKIDNARTVTLRGNVRGDLARDRDLGPVEDGLELHLYFVLARTAERQAALDNLIDRQQQPTAAEFHKWLTPAEFGERFGASEQDIAKISAWLESRGMKVNGVMNNASFISFSATGRDIREVFGTQLHYFDIGGGKHPALIADPRIPAALISAVAGIEGLNKIPPTPSHTAIRQTAYDAATHRWHPVHPEEVARALPADTDGTGEWDVTPQDFYTIYNVNPILTAGNKGLSSTVAVVEESDIEYGTVNATTGVTLGGDVALFRRLFGVAGTLNMHVYHGSAIDPCNDPGVDPNGSGEESEAALDAEWASALAPAANLVFMSCDNVQDQGILTSEMALIDSNMADVMSLSYGETELKFAASDYIAQDTLFAEAAAQGQSFIVSSGDSGSDVADQDTTGSAIAGINVSGYGSPLVTVAGGTDFADAYDQHQGGFAQSTYWGATNSAYYGDALGYVPETAWNDSCASSIEANYNGYTGALYCELGPEIVTQGINGYVVGGSGGFSTHYAVPAYQTGIKGYAGTKRAQPDIAAFAANGWWGHALINCDSYVAATNCSSSTNFGAGGGTSYVAPQMAGIFGLLVSYTGSRQGLLNPALYALAKAQYTAAATETACYSNGQTSNIGVTTSRPAAACIFNDVTSSNNDEPCAAGTLNCYVGGSGYGMLSTTGPATLTVAFPSTPGYDEVSGIGTPNVTNLIENWYKAYTSTTTLTATATSLTPTTSTSLKATVKGGTPVGLTPTAPAPPLAGTATFKAGTTTLGSCTLSAGVCSLPVLGSAFAAGANSVTATFSGSKTYPSSTSAITTITETGSGTPAVTLSLTSLAFGTVTDGTTSATQTVKVTNSGTGTLDVTSIALEGGAGSLEFAVTANLCGTTLAAGANCTFGVVFKPQTAGTYYATVGVTDNATGSPQGVAVSGTGSAATQPTVSLSVPSLAFGSETVGVETAAQTVTLKNTGTLAVSITSIALTGAGASSYVITAKTCTTTLAVAASCTFSAAFKPTANGLMSAAIAVTDNASGSPQSVSLTGTGTGGSSGPLSLTPTPLNFGSENVGNLSEAQLITIKNTSAASLTLQSISFFGAYPTSFTQLDTCYAVLTAGSSCYALVSFYPQTTGTLSASYDVESGGVYYSAVLNGTGIPLAALTLSPSPVTFPVTVHGTQSVASILTVTNTGTSTATFSYMGIGGTNYSDFFELNTCGTSLAAGAKCDVFVIFRPTAAGTYTATMEFFDTAQAGYQGVTLNGTAN